MLIYHLYIFFGEDHIFFMLILYAATLLNSLPALSGFFFPFISIYSFCFPEHAGS